MESDEGKLFIGGIAWDTTEEKLKDYFSHYGDVSQALIMRDKTTGRPRGFAFVVFSDPSLLDVVLQDSHTIDGRTVEAKRALSREEQQTSSRSGNLNAGRGGSAGNFKTKKIFVGGLPSTLTEEGFRQYFENYGHVTDVVVMYDQNTQRPRGFGFITFDTEDAVDMVLQKTFHELNGKLVEVKKALPKDANPGGATRGTGGSGVYQSYGASAVNAVAFDVGNRYMQSQTSAGGFPPYSGYAGYNYGAVNTGIGYGGYTGYGYGGTSTGFGGPTGAYGNPNGPNAGYARGGSGALKSTWGSQTPSNYGSSGYGAVPAPGIQSPSGASGYSNQGYGYGNYGVSDVPYSGGYGAAGGRSGYAPNSNSGNAGGGPEQQGSGYGDTNGNAGYVSAAWRADPSQASGGYGDGYGGAHSRRA
ncbi:RRM_1 domain-containing protein [Cephalotus follicularis]|uniref:RRM_1 domain-containing protein n=1 Tax=Cephalotus follicularis TaxID=3775 RepID=A0A1Q3CRP0_CEPFO|nr:RRM_1 domain-containing protein [Cephalotus follicularis]